MTSAGWEHFHHVADIGVRGYGATVDVNYNILITPVPITSGE